MAVTIVVGFEDGIYLPPSKYNDVLIEQLTGYFLLHNDRILLATDEDYASGRNQMHTISHRTEKLVSKCPRLSEYKPLLERYRYTVFHDCVTAEGCRYNKADENYLGYLDRTYTLNKRRTLFLSNNESLLTKVHQKNLQTIDLSAENWLDDLRCAHHEATNAARIFALTA